MSFTYRITLVHQSKSRPNWNNKIIDDIKALNIYDETTVDTKWNEYTHNNGKIVGAVVFANHLSNWYQHDEAYYQSIDMAYGPYCHGVSDYVEFDQPGQELLQQRLKLVEWMKQQTDKFEHYDLMKEYYPDAQNTMDLLHKWAQPFVPLTAIHIQELARMLNKNLLLITVGQHYPYTYHHFQYNDNAECLVITHYHWGHFDRIVGVNGQLSVKSIEFFDAQYADLENTDANDEKNEPNSDEIPPLKPPAYTQNKKRKKHITNVAFGMDSDDENEEMCMWNTNN
eukprot:218897_1